MEPAVGDNTANEASEHTKGARPSTRERHKQGQATRDPVAMRKENTSLLEKGRMDGAVHDPQKHRHMIVFHNKIIMEG